MSRITGAEISRVERDVEDYFDKTANIYVATTARSQAGGTTQTWPSTPTRTSPAQIGPMSPNIEAQFAERLGGRQGWVVSLRSVTRVPISARIKVDGRTFEVIGSDIGRSYQFRQRIPVTELT